MFEGYDMTDNLGVLIIIFFRAAKHKNGKPFYCLDSL
jgi:hypothetical protein